MGIVNYSKGVASFGTPLFGSLGIGNVYMVGQTADTSAYTDFAKRYTKVRHADGSMMLHPFIGTGSVACTTNGIQTALDACLTNRNDYVVVAPSDSNYGLDAVATLSKKAVHLVCPSGIGYGNFPIGNSARIKQLTAASVVFALSNQAIEIAGFYIKNYTALGAITLAAAAHSPNIHSNMFTMVWSGAQAASIAGATTGGAWGSIEHNWFISESGTAQTAAIGCVDIAAQATGCRVCHNEITIGDANTATVCISNLATKGHTDYNVFATGGGTGGTGVITNAIVIPTLEACIGNRGAVAAGCLLSGGTTATSFCDNLDATATAGTDHWNLAA
jgi:hypothetical protein